jgi:hypothetical protein
VVRWSSFGPRLESSSRFRTLSETFAPMRRAGVGAHSFFDSIQYAASSYPSGVFASFDPYGRPGSQTSFSSHVTETSEVQPAAAPVP